MNPRDNWSARTNGTQVFPTEIAETVVYPRCQLANYTRGNAHDFTDALNAAGQPVIYCRQCGLVSPLEVKP